MSLPKELEKLLLPAPTLPDLEDEDIDGIFPRTVRTNKFSEGNEGDNSLVRANLNNDSKYKGEKVSRKELFGDFAEISGLADNKMRNGMNEIEQGYNEEDSTNSEDNSESNIEGSEERHSDQEELDGNDNVDELTTGNVLISSVKEKETIKTSAVRCQLSIWEQLLYLKIKLQTAIRLYNQLPRGQLAKELLKNAEEETKNYYITAKSNVRRIILLLLEAEHELLIGSPFTKPILGECTGEIDSGDEEITSSEDERNDEAEVFGEMFPSSNNEIEKKLGWRAMVKAVQDNEEKFVKFRDATLTKWDERTRLTTMRKSKEAKKDFSAFENGIVQHIDKILADKARLIKRSQTKRSETDRIGGDPEADEDPEIYDDDDFYQILLKELIDKKTSKTQDPACMTRHYIEMQKLKTRRPKKQVVDNRASKERKIKYVAIPKLVNFHPAKPEVVEFSHESRNELFKSLFS